MISDIYKGVLINYNMVKELSYGSNKIVGENRWNKICNYSQEVRNKKRRLYSYN
jgi:hypothetical protein